MIIIDECLAVRVTGGSWPEGLPDNEDLALPASRHWRLLQRMHAPGDGQLSQILTQLSDAGRDSIRHPHPRCSVSSIPGLCSTTLPPWPPDSAAACSSPRPWPPAWFTSRALFFGSPANVGRHLARAAEELGITVHVIT